VILTLKHNTSISIAATVIPRKEYLNAVNVTQLEKDTLMICYDSKLAVLISLPNFQKSSDV
jgi:hypothetical protein